MRIKSPHNIADKVIIFAAPASLCGVNLQAIFAFGIRQIARPDMVLNKQLVTKRLVIVAVYPQLGQQIINIGIARIIPFSVVVAVRRVCHGTHRIDTPPQNIIQPDDRIIVEMKFN